MGESAAVSKVSNAADRLLAALDRAGAPACVGIDPVVDRLPAVLRPADGSPQRQVGALVTFAMGVLDAVAPRVGCVKIQSACFERYRQGGVDALHRVIGAAADRGLQVILDAKRGDISVSADHYAASVFDRLDGEPGPPDWVTINSYLGADGIKPFLRPGFGAFALVRTSNPGGDDLQGQRLADGRTVAELVADLIAATGRTCIGESGYSALGAVVGATKPAEIAALRAIMPRQILLVPGFGAQGGGADDIGPCFDEAGRGAVITASRSVIYAFEPDSPSWTEAVGDAAARFADQVRKAAKGR